LAARRIIRINRSGGSNRARRNTMDDDSKSRVREEPGQSAEPHDEEIDSCGLCAALLSKKEGGSASCGGSRKSSGGAWRFMTEREFSVLKAMRGLREKAARIKKRIRALEKEMHLDPRQEERPRSPEEREEDSAWERQMAEELLRHCERLDRLKAQWKEMDQERMAAQEERMRLLGHIQ